MVLIGYENPVRPGEKKILSSGERTEPADAIQVFERVALGDGGQNDQSVWTTFLPGFPDGSFGWAKVDHHLGDNGMTPKIHVEYVGQGDSDKPSKYPYGTMERADLVEAQWESKGIQSTFIVSFDYSSLVTLELLSRQEERMKDDTKKEDQSESSRLRRILLWVALAFLIVLAVGGSTMAFYLADIRPAQLRKGSISEAAAAKGKALLERAADMHGMQKWNRHNNLEIMGIDDWVHWMGRAFINPFAKAQQKIRLQLLLGTWTSRLEILDAAGVTEVWGIQAWHTYRSQVGQHPVFQADEKISFFLPTFQWWLEFPFRIVSAPIVTALSESQDSRFDRVFVTWSSLEPHRELDQYIVYINKGTGLIDRIEYTIRDMGGFAKIDRIDFILNSEEFAIAFADFDVTIAFRVNDECGIW